MYYFDQASTSLQKPKTVATAVYESINQENIGNPSRGGHEPSLQASRVVFKTREIIKELFNAHNYDVVFTKNATEAINLAIKGLFKKGDHILTTTMEHNSVLRPLFELEKEAIDIGIIQCDKEEGTLLYENFKNMITPNTKGIILTHASNVTGNVNNLEWLSDLCYKKGLYLIVDASQTAGAININLNNLAIDILCFTGHKSLYGPQGTGGICIKKGLQLKPLLTGGSGVHSFLRTQPTILPESLEAGTINVHGLSGLYAGIKYILHQNIKNIEKQILELTIYMYEELKKINKIKIYGNFKDKHTGVISINIADRDSSEISTLLYDKYEIATRSGIHCAPLIHKHFKTDKQGMVRFSFSYFNNIEEINYALNSIKEIVNK